MSSLQDEKQALRAALRARRVAAAGMGVAAAADLAECFLNAVSVPPRATVAGYLLIRDEISVCQLMSRLAGQGCQIALPAVIEPGAPLAFRAWREGDRLVEGMFGTREPAVGAPELLPEVMILPLLAFDRCGYRLGYGGGYYDRTLAVLRQERRVLAVGAGFAAQEVTAVPRGRHDQVLDWIVTEREAIEVRSST